MNNWKIHNFSEIIPKAISGEWGDDVGETKILRTTNFQNDGTINYSSVVTRSISQKKIDQKALKFGDTIIEKSGGSPTQPVGRVVYFDLTEDIFLCNNFTSVLRPSAGVDSKYVFWFLFNNHLIGKTLNYQNKTTGIINLKLERYLQELQIPLPPLQIQKRISEIIDKADCLRKKDKQLLQHYDELATNLFSSVFGDPVRNERGWDTDILGNHIEKIQIGPFGTQLHVEDYITNGIPLINPMHISKGKVLEQAKFSISQEKYTELKNYHLKKGDIIMGRRGEMGRCALIRDRENGWVCGTGSLYIRPGTGFNPLFLSNVLSSKSVKEHLARSAQGVTMANLNKTIVFNIPTIYPPVDLQNIFAQQIENIENQKEKAENQLEQSENLFQVLLQEAFNGGLN